MPVYGADDRSAGSAAWTEHVRPRHAGDYCVATSAERTYDETSVVNRWNGIMKHHRSLLASSIGLAAPLLIGLGAAQSQSLTPNVTYNNPPTMPKPPGYTQVVEANTPGRILFIAGQLGYDAAGKLGADFRTQTTLVFENLKAAVESVGGHMENIVKLNTYLTDIRVQLPIVREIRDKYVNTAAPPASTTLEIQKLAREGAIEIEAIAVLPAK